MTFFKAIKSIFTNLDKSIALIILSIKCTLTDFRMLMICIIRVLLLPTVIGTTILLVMYIKDHLTPSAYVPFFAIFIALLITSALGLLMNVVTIAYTRNKYNHQSTSLCAAFYLGIKRIPTIMLWTIVHGLILFIISIAKNKNSHSKSIVAEFFTFAWRVATFFVPGVITKKNIFPYPLFKESVKIMKERFGEVATMTFSFATLANFSFPGIPLILSILMTYFYMAIHHYETYIKGALAQSSEKAFNQSLLILIKEHYIFFICLCFITYILRIIIFTSENVAKAALFNYAEHENTGPFKEQLIRHIFITKKNQSHNQ